MKIVINFCVLSMYTNPNYAVSTLTNSKSFKAVESLIMDYNKGNELKWKNLDDILKDEKIIEIIYAILHFSNTGAFSNKDILATYDGYIYCLVNGNKLQLQTECQEYYSDKIVEMSNEIMRDYVEQGVIDRFADRNNIKESILYINLSIVQKNHPIALIFPEDLNKNNKSNHWLFIDHCNGDDENNDGNDEGFYV